MSDAQYPSTIGPDVDCDEQMKSHAATLARYLLHASVEPSEALNLGLSPLPASQFEIFLSIFISLSLSPLFHRLDHRGHQ